MSYFDDASLVMIPSGYKTSKVYSVKPTDGTGDLTFTRSNDTATRVGPDGLIEKVRTNLNLYSQDFTNAVYVTGGFGSRASVAANTTANPLNGAQDADTATFTAGGLQSRLLEQFSGLSTTNKYTYSIYVKAGTKNTIKIYGDVSVTGVVAEFNLSTGSVVGTPTLCTASIVSAGSGWYRCSITFNAQGAGSADCGPVSWAGEDGTLFIYGAQLEVSDFGATDYIATTSAAVSVGPVANVPRLDYLNSSCPRLLLEPQRTNLFQYSEQLDNAYWSKIGSITVTANNAVSPDGYQNADLVTGASGSARIQRAFSGLTAGTRTLSCFVKAGTGSGVTINSYDGIVDKSAIFNVVTGVVDSTSAGVSATITNYGNGWYRLTHTYTSAGTSYSCQFFFDDGLTYRVWGMQFEDSASYATSYIPTLGAAVTRGADAASKTGISSLIGQTEGTLFAEFTIPETQSPSFFSISDGTAANRIIFGYYQGLLRYYTNSATGSFSSAAVIDAAPVVGQTYKIAIAYKANDFKVYKNGSNTNTETTFTVPASLTALDNEGGGVGQNIYAGVKQLLLFKTRLTNAQLAELTA